MAEEGEPTVSTQGAIDYLGVSRATLFRMLAKKELLPVNYNPALLRQPPMTFRVSDLDRIKAGGRPRKKREGRKRAEE